MRMVHAIKRRRAAERRAIEAAGKGKRRPASRSPAGEGGGGPNDQHRSWSIDALLANKPDGVQRGVM